MRQAKHAGSILRPTEINCNGIAMQYCGLEQELRSSCDAEISSPFADSFIAPDATRNDRLAYGRQTLSPELGPDGTPSVGGWSACARRSASRASAGMLVSITAMQRSGAPGC